MTGNDIEVLSGESGNVIVRVADDPVPACIIEGDALFLMHAKAMDLIEELKHNPDSEVFYSAYALAKRLEQRLTHYIDTCEQHGVEVDFRLEYSIEDYADLMYNRF